MNRTKRSTQPKKREPTRAPEACPRPVISPMVHHLRRHARRVELDERAACMECGSLAAGGILLAGRVRPLCPMHHAAFANSPAGGRCLDWLDKYDAIHKSARVGVHGRRMQAWAAYHLFDWLNLRSIERRRLAEHRPAAVVAP